MERCKISKKKKYFRCFEVSTCPPGQVRTCPNHDFSGPDMSRSRLFRSGHDQIRTFGEILNVLGSK